MSLSHEPGKAYAFLLGQWYMDKMKMQDAQLMQASGDTTSTVDDWSSVMGTTPATKGTNSHGTASQDTNRPSWQGLQVHKSGTIHTHSSTQTNKHMYDWILLDTCSSINLVCNQSFCVQCAPSQYYIIPSNECRNNDSKP